MNWVAVIWSVSSGACLALGIMQLFIWLKSNLRSKEFLALAFAAFAVAGIALGEWLMMVTQEPDEYARVLRWTHVPVMVLFVAIVAFFRFHFRTGISWLAWTVIGLRGIILALNFVMPENASFLLISALKQIHFLGERVYVVAGAVPNPCNWIAQLSLVLLLWYVVDASLKLWRRGGPDARRKAVLVGGGIVVFVLIAGTHTILIHRQIIQSPYIISFAFFGIILPMAYELSNDVLVTVRITKDLLQLQQQMTLATSSAKVGLWSWDIPKDVFWGTPEARSMHGFSPDEPLSMERIYTVIHPDDREASRAAVTRALASGGAYAADYRVALPDGAIRWIAARGNVEFDSDTTPQRMSGVSLDNTDRKLAEERSRLVVEAAPNAMIMVDSSATMVLVNNQAETTFGYSREEMIGQPIELLISGRFKAGHPAMHKNFFANPVARAMGAGRDLFGRRKDGTEVPVEVGLNPIQTSEGKFVLASIIDITERKREEKEANEQRAELAHLSRISSLGQLSGSLAHELNQPLGIILSNAQAAKRMLERESPDLVELRAILADIVDEDRRAGEVIKRLRALLKRGEARLLPLSPNDIIEDVLRLLRSDIIGRSVTVRTDFAEGLPEILGDLVQLQQAVLNIIINACDAMAENPPPDRVIQITTSQKERAVRISLEDHGCGLPNGDASQIFNSFFTTKTHGMGIGLSICRAIITAHHGRIWAEPNSGRGTTLHMELQIVEPAVS